MHAKPYGERKVLDTWWFRGSMIYLSTCCLRSSLRKLWSNHKWRSKEEVEWRHPLKHRPPRGGKIKPSGKREHMQPYL